MARILIKARQGRTYVASLCFFGRRIGKRGLHAKSGQRADGRDEKNRSVAVRGSLGYAGMKQKDVVTEIWKLADDKLRLIWRREAVGFVRPALRVHDFDRDGSMELVIYAPFGNGKSIEVVKPEFNR